MWYTDTMIANYIKETMNSKGSSAIRKMFEEGIALKAKYGSDKVFDFSLGNPDLDPPDALFDAISKVAQEKSHGCHGYMPNAGYSQARDAMAEKETLEQGLHVSGSSVVMSCGAAGAMNCLFKAVINPGDEVVVPAPFFGEYRHYVHNQQGTLVEVPSRDDFSLDTAAIAAVLNAKTAAVIINSPNNPSGKVYSIEDIKALADVLEVHGKKTGRYPYLICDEPYRAIVFDGKKVAPVFPFYKSSVIVTSFAKNLSIPGERIGYICVNPACPDCAEVVAACIFTTRILGYVNAPAFFQKVVALSWNTVCDYSLYEKRCMEMMAVLDHAGIKYAKPEGAFYLFCKVPDEWKDDDMAFVNHLKDFLILCAPGSGFGYRGWFRIAYCVSEKTILDSKEIFYKAVQKK
jgi:aspartate aminotransferase